MKEMCSVTHIYNVYSVVQSFEYYDINFVFIIDW